MPQKTLSHLKKLPTKDETKRPNGSKNFNLQGYKLGSGLRLLQPKLPNQQKQPKYLSLRDICGC